MKTKQTIIVFVLLLCSIYLVTAEQGLEINEDTLTLTLCYELQELDIGYEDYLLANNLDACNLFLSQWDTDGDWFGNEEELEIGTDPEDPTENPNTIESYGTMPQAEPNGLFSPVGLSATWLMMIDPETNEPLQRFQHLLG